MLTVANISQWQRGTLASPPPVLRETVTKEEFEGTVKFRHFVPLWSRQRTTFVIYTKRSLNVAIVSLMSLIVDVSSLPPAPMSVALLMLFSGKGGTVRGCLSGSLWLKSVGLVSVSPAEAISPGSAATFRFLPAPGARSKFSSITVSFDSQNGIRKRGRNAVHSTKCLSFRVAAIPCLTTKKTPLSLVHTGVSFNKFCHGINTTFSHFL